MVLFVEHSLSQITELLNVILPFLGVPTLVFVSICPFLHFTETFLSRTSAQKRHNLNLKLSFRYTKEPRCTIQDPHIHKKFINPKSP
ncbi:hypothetical protein EJ08DRAFT_60404 [Tothia fuscella]|uniref:Uncharacterized protein n=1 Tax=Tothia fuscella TaxID=1048955 RepID=A0A9P4NXP7_9PEZI|nr:hypothetical protein EJ08DRAFT_60404 [Tothia fuscella]